jgi:hypothetical protein
MRKQLVVMGLGAAFLALIAFADSPPEVPEAQAASECGIVGTWFGVGDSGTAWMDVATPGVSPTSGQFEMEWVSLDPTLGGYFPDAVRATRAGGVWRQLSVRTFRYTWIAYGLALDGSLVYTVRVSGTKTRRSCNRLDVSYVLELWLPEQTVSEDPPFFCMPGTATETRMTLVQGNCQQ